MFQAAAISMSALLFIADAALIRHAPPFFADPPFSPARMLFQHKLVDVVLPRITPRR